MDPFISAIKNYAEELKNCAVWHNSREAVGCALDSENYYIYEFYCLMRLLNDLNINYSIKYEAGKDDKRNKFPKGPAPKKDRPYFKLLDKNGALLYQICAGTEIKVKAGEKTDSPDISFQLAESPLDEPSYEHVKLIMDAKYSESKEVSKGSYNDFAMMIKKLDLENAKIINIKYDKLSGVIGNCLISNGKAYTDDVNYISDDALCEMEYFNEEDDFNIIVKKDE